jgi:glycerate kinase
MKPTVVIALDSFKGSIGAADASAAVAAGWRTVHSDHHVVLCPMADGGEGTLDAFAAAVPGATRRDVTVTGPEDRPIPAAWLLLPPTEDAPTGTAVVELASTSGIELLGEPPRLRPLDAHTIGFGEAIAAALDHGVSRLVLGIGSSASTDGGTGMLTALGGRFEDDEGKPILRGGRGLSDLAASDLSSLRPPPPGGAIALSDVTNPLLGPHGAAAVFGPQKGATLTDVRSLDEGLARLAAQLSVDPATPGAGAAGGTGYGLLAWGATLSPGAVSVAELIGLPGAIRTASLVITGEGSYDGQSAAGKAPWHVATLAEGAGVPVALVAGRITANSASAHFTAQRSLTDLAGSPELAMRDPARWLKEAGAGLAREVQLTAR